MQLSVEALDDLVMLINNRSLEKDKPQQKHTVMEVRNE